MNFKKLNEQLEKYTINEISDKLKASYLQGKQAKLDKAKADMEKAKNMVAKSDARQIANLPKGTDKETAKEALEELKYQMKRYDDGSDWRLEYNEENKTMELSVRYWGEWEGDDGSGDYDWQTLSNEDRIDLNSILKKVQKNYNIQIREINSEKNWLDFEIAITKLTKDSVLDINTETELRKLVKEVDGNSLKIELFRDAYPTATFNIKLYNTDSYSPYLEDIECIIILEPSLTLSIENTDISEKDYNSLSDVFVDIKQLIKDRNEEVENAKKAKKVKREQAVWLDNKLLKEKPQVKWLNIVNDHLVNLRTRTDNISLQKIDRKKTSIIKITINDQSKNVKVDPNAEFKDWIEIALQNI